jgi:hypothetical protein
MTIITDKSPIDAWTLVHGLWGYLGKKQGLTTTQIMIISTLYELIEDTVIENGMNQVGWTKEEKHNALVDILAAYLGSELA